MLDIAYVVLLDFYVRLKQISEAPPSQVPRHRVATTLGARADEGAAQGAGRKCDGRKLRVPSS